jgi:branched-chain amino acid transport system substrate-binding protein
MASTWQSTKINAAGGVLGKKVRVIVEDDRGEPAEAKTVVTKLITKDNVWLYWVRSRLPTAWLRDRSLSST